MSSARIIAPADRPAPMRIAGFDIQTMISGDEGVNFEVFFTAGPDGTGPAPHCHQWDETFFVLQGPVAFGVGDQEQWIEAGTLLHVPGGGAALVSLWRSKGGIPLLHLRQGRQPDVPRTGRSSRRSAEARLPRGGNQARPDGAPGWLISTLDIPQGAFAAPPCIPIPVSIRSIGSAPKPCCQRLSTAQ